MSDYDELEIDENAEDEELYFNYDIISYPSDLTLKGITDMWNNNDFIIPPFQRKFVWTIKQASLLIESFLMGLPIPQIFLYLQDDNKFLIIDGLQRIMSVVYFFEGYFGDESVQGKRQTFKLTGLSPQSPFSEKKFSDLDEIEQRKLKSRILRAINVRQSKPEDEGTSMYQIFERLNTGGTPLKPQEIRNCVFRGELNNILTSLNKDKNWRRIVGKNNLDKHQKDIELILRVFALTGNWKAYEKPMKEFLNSAMEKHRNGNTAKVLKFKNDFVNACEIVCDTLGEKPFHLKGPLNSSALDSILCTIIENIDSLHPHLKSQFEKLKDNDDFQFSTYYGTSDVTTLHLRFELAHEYLLKRK